MKKTLFIIGLSLFITSNLFSQIISNEAFRFSNSYGDLQMRRYISGDLTFKRALVPASSTLLAINYAGDFSEGVKVMGSKLIVDGNLGIGTTTPDSKLTVKGHVNIGADGNYHLKTRHIDGKSHISTDVDHLFLNYGIDKNVYVGNLNSGTPDSHLFVSGNLGIGTTTPDSKLTVAGKIHSQEVKVTIDAGADFVFNENYNLPKLEDVEKFVKINKHLPEIASEKEMQENGLLLAEMNIKLLQKIEELTLYTINQEKRIETLEQENNTLKEQQEKISVLEEKVNLLLNLKP